MDEDALNVLLADDEIPPAVAVAGSIVDDEPARDLPWTVWAVTLAVVIGLLLLALV